jgi:hypothetical protein
MAVRDGGAGRQHPLTQKIRLYLTYFLNSRIQVNNSKNRAKTHRNRGAARVLTMPALTMVSAYAKFTES